jgi:hypothetical protein
MQMKIIINLLAKRAPAGLELSCQNTNLLREIMMLFQKLFVAAAAFVSLQAFAADANTSSIEGTWQGPCEVRGALSVKFTYAITAPDENGAGTVDKTKIYYKDAACEVYGRTGRQAVSYVIGETSEDGIATFDVNHRGTLLYDIVSLSEDGNVLTFGNDHSTKPDTRPTVLSTTDRVFTRVIDQE